MAGQGGAPIGKDERERIGETLEGIILVPLLRYVCKL